MGCVLYEDKLPVHDDTRKMAFEFNIGPVPCALNGGEDYELLFTVSQQDYEKVASNNEVTIIGYITPPEEGKILLTKGGNKHPLTAQGWTAFG